MTTAAITVGVAACWSDLEAAQRLAERMKGDGLAARLICAGANAGDDGACDVVVALWSAAAATSLWVRRAAAEAGERDRLVEASLNGAPAPQRRPLAPVRLHDGPAAAARVAERVRRCAAGRAQGQPPAQIAGQALIAAATAAAVAGPFLWLASQERQSDALAHQQVQQPNEIAEVVLPAPTPGEAPRDPEPRGNGQGGPLIDKAP